MTELIKWADSGGYCNADIGAVNLHAVFRAALVLGQTMPEMSESMAETQDEAKDDFDHWWRGLRFSYFGADEATTPNHRHKARALGWKHLVPPQYLWPHVALVVRVADIVRESVGRAVRLRNLWRPTNYNHAVGGSPDGDHPDACGVDLDFSSREDQRVAEGVVRSLYPRSELQLSVGLGAKALHVGVLSQRNRRRWFYSSASPDQRRGFRDRWYTTVQK